MTFGNGADQAPRTAPGAYQFGLTPTSQTAIGPDGAPRRNRRRRSGPDRSVVIRAIVIVLLSAVVLAVAGIVALSLVQQSEEKVRADSAPFCADLASTPGILSQPGFGWPTEVTDLPTTVTAMRAYEERWSTLATIGPPSIREDLRAVATAAGTIATSVESTQSINRPATLESIQGVTSKTDVAAWAAKYCN
jgi:hypothetical protein